jgi:hypothetical protein
MEMSMIRHCIGIRYAVDNGAKVINGSLEKLFTTHTQWVYDALKYAKKKMLFVHAAEMTQKILILLRISQMTLRIK